MGKGLVDRVKQAFAQKPREVSSPQSGAPSRQRDVGQSMTFEQATSFLAPGGGMEEGLRPPAQKGPNGAQKKAPSDLGVALGVAKGLASSAAQKKAPTSVYMNPGPGAKAPASKAQAQATSLYMNGGPGAQAPASNAQAPAPQAPTSLYMNGGPGAQATGSNEGTVTNGDAEAPLYQTDLGPSTDAPHAAPAPRVDDGQPDSAMERGAHYDGDAALLTEAEQDQVAELAVALPEDEPDPLAAQRKAAEVDVELSTRLQLTADEKRERGFVLMPMLSSQRDFDERGQANGGFDTVYHYDDEADLARNKAGSKQSTARKDHVLSITDGKFVRAQTGELMDTSDADLPGFLIAERVRERAKALGKRTLDDDEKVALKEELQAEGGRYIFVMNGRGEILAGHSIYAVQHHSSFMGGGAVAAAGEIVITGGVPKLVSNMSGHYQAGPGFLWQALWAMSSQGVSLSGVMLELYEIGKVAADWFMREFDPMAMPELMGRFAAVSYLHQKLAKAGPAAREVRNEGKEEAPDATSGKTETTYV